jgi:hypothetical protein
MEYELLSDKDKIDILNERMLNLEKHIFHNEVLLTEHESIGLFDEEGLTSLNMQIATYTAQIAVIEEIKSTIQANQTI